MPSPRCRARNTATSAIAACWQHPLGLSIFLIASLTLIAFRLWPAAGLMHVDISGRDELGQASHACRQVSIIFRADASSPACGFDFSFFIPAQRCAISREHAEGRLLTCRRAAHTHGFAAQPSPRDFDIMYGHYARPCAAPLSLPSPTRGAHSSSHHDFQPLYTHDREPPPPPLPSKGKCHAQPLL